MNTFYLNRNPVRTNNCEYTLTNYIPCKSPKDGELCWRYERKIVNKGDCNYLLHLNKDNFFLLQSMFRFNNLGNDIKSGTSINLTTGEILNIEDAKCILEYFNSL